MRWRTMRRKLERAKGIEPSSKAWEALVLPLNHARAAGKRLILQVAWARVQVCHRPAQKPPQARQP
ncbi:hypothetical protein DF3PA_150020 [Candidatus Defluviicoccus seviourii]|uniref:Uncharacterized protein n=1 Tax=Candidatus Defluviicoccus seviourii TaxID=2565273 RepID=A0A564WDY5_9PROT|nr:hypothetical protein DF3PA_150020 [Candidatus Defluviicoccus seviourii]